MKIHLIKKETIEEFARKNASSRPSFEAWIQKIKYSSWEKPSDMQDTFSAADLLGNKSGRVVFNIGGNNNRMICKYAFGEAQAHLFVCWIGSHTEYDQLCRNNQQYTINLY